MKRSTLVRNAGRFLAGGLLLIMGVLWWAAPEPLFCASNLEAAAVVVGVFLMGFGTAGALL